LGGDLWTRGEEKNEWVSEGGREKERAREREREDRSTTKSHTHPL